MPCPPTPAPRVPQAARLRAVALLPRCTAPLAALFATLKGGCDGVSLADSTALAVCDNRRIPRRRVIEGLAVRGEMSMDFQTARHRQLEKRTAEHPADTQQHR